MIINLTKKELMVIYQALAEIRDLSDDDAERRDLAELKIKVAKHI